MQTHKLLTTYTGAESVYRVEVLTYSIQACKVRILSLISGPGSIPNGAKVTLPTNRLSHN